MWYMQNIFNVIVSLTTGKLLVTWMIDECLSLAKVGKQTEIKIRPDQLGI